MLRTHNAADTMTQFDCGLNKYISVVRILLSYMMQELLLNPDLDEKKEKGRPNQRENMLLCI